MIVGSLGDGIISNSSSFNAITGDVGLILDGVPDGIFNVFLVSRGGSGR